VRYVVKVKEKYLKTKYRFVDTINAISTEGSVKQNSIIILNTLSGWQNVLASKRPEHVATPNSSFNIILELCLTDSSVDIPLLQHNRMDHIKTVDTILKCLHYDLLQI
jgi:hypothetical protein